MSELVAKALAVSGSLTLSSAVNRWLFLVCDAVCWLLTVQKAERAPPPVGKALSARGH